jgi:FKBP-type peptidyl-prolyl cis-trans isomerase
MKAIKAFSILFLAVLVFTGCGKISYKKSKSGLVYKIFPGKGSDSLIRTGDVVKFNFTLKFNDSAMESFNSYDKMPGFVKVRETIPGKFSYDFQEVLTFLRKGDSLITIQIVDTLLKQPEPPPFLPANAKKGDRLTTTIRIVEVFKNDSLAQVDFSRESDRDRPRQMKEQEVMMAKKKKEKDEQIMKDDEEMTKSGEIAKETQAMEKYIADNKINATKTGKGTYVEIKQQGSGPFAEAKKYVLVKYTGRFLSTDSIFQSNTAPFQLGQGEVIRGWEEGMLLFKEGGKGTLFIPGFLAFGKNPPPGSSFKPLEALKFEVELIKVSDKPIEQPMEPQAKKPTK